MAGRQGHNRIRDEDIALVRERTSIADVISEYVTLKPAGGGNLKGLCPFHDEKTPSFNVSPPKGVYFCYGCGAGGDSLTFVMTQDHLSFVEAVERLAGRPASSFATWRPARHRYGQQGQRQRLVAANAEAAAFYADQLGTARRPGRPASSSPSAASTRPAPRRTAAASLPTPGTPLTKHLRQKGFTAEELVTAGLAKEARSGSLIDRFRRRLLWPIRDLNGDVIGFGARKLFDDDDGPKYLNTPETPLYKKSHVLYGIDRAKREIAKQGRAVIVEGYTDVMACHLAGVPTAVATCGTAFGADHIGVLRRLLLDTDAYAGEIIFTFDGDAAGQKAALRAFEDEQRFVAQTYIAVSPDNMDPCDLRLAKGDVAVRDLVARREPLIAFALRSHLSRYDLDLAEGRVAALRATAPLVAKIKDRALRPEYVRKLAGDLGMEIEAVNQAVASAAGRRGDPVVLPPGSASRPTPTTHGPLWSVRRSSSPCRSPCWPARCSTRSTRRRTRTRCTSRCGRRSPSWVGRPRPATARSGSRRYGTRAPTWRRRRSWASCRSSRCGWTGDADPRYVAVQMSRLQLYAVNRRIAEVKSKAPADQSGHESGRTPAAVRRAACRWSSRPARCGSRHREGL